MTLVTASTARVLAARGSRDVLGASDPAGPLSATTTALLGELPSWWARRAAAAGLSGSWLDLDHAIDQDALVVTGRSSVLDAVETGEQLGHAYVEGLAAGVRARHGRHYTPPQLSRQLWTMTRSALGARAAASSAPGLVRDPACGAGALLLPVVREQVQALVRSDPGLALSRMPNVVEGIDTDPIAVHLANVVLAAEMLPLLAALPESRRRPLPTLARVGDGLAPADHPVHAVVMNPPYGRVRLDAAERARFADVLYGHANLYGLFLGAALNDLDDDGVLAALVPTSFTSGRYFTALRAGLSSRTHLREISFVDSRSGVFSGVLQETCLAVFTRKRQTRTRLSSISDTVTPVAQVRASRGAGPWLLPRRADDAPVAAAAARMPLTLAAAGWRASTGPLVWNRRTADLHARPGQGRRRVLWAADIDGGAVHRDPARDSLRYLDLTQPSDQKVMVLDQPAVLVQRTTAPEQTRRLVVAELSASELEAWDGAVVVENHVNVLRAAVEAPLLSRTTVTRLLSTITMDRLMRCVSGSVAVSAYELDSLPLPSAEVLTEWEQTWPDLSDDRVEEMVRSIYWHEKKTAIQ